MMDSTGLWIAVLESMQTQQIKDLSNAERVLEVADISFS